MLPFVDHIILTVIDLVNTKNIALVLSAVAVTGSFEIIEELARIYCSDHPTPSLIRIEWQQINFVKTL